MLLPVLCHRPRLRPSGLGIVPWPKLAVEWCGCCATRIIDYPDSISGRSSPGPLRHGLTGADT